MLLSDLCVRLALNIIVWVTLLATIISGNASRLSVVDKAQSERGPPFLCLYLQNSSSGVGWRRWMGQVPISGVYGVVLC